MEVRLEKNLKDLPGFAVKYINSSKYSVSTKLMYVYDIKEFLYYLDDCGCTYGSIQKDTNIRNYIEEYIDQIKSGKVLDKNIGKRTTKRKLASLRSFLSYCEKEDLLPAGTAYLTTYSVSELPEEAHNIRKNRSIQEITEKPALRNEAILRLVLDNGLSVSDCVNIDLDDLDENSLVIKGEEKDICITLDQDTYRCLLEYIQKRKSRKTETNALFISSRNRRISETSVYYIINSFFSESKKEAKATG